MRIMTPESLRELSTALRQKMPAMKSLAEVLEQCATEIESRDAQIEGLRLALTTKGAAS